MYTSYVKDTKSTATKKGDSKESLSHNPDLGVDESPWARGRAWTVTR